MLKETFRRLRIILIRAISVCMARQEPELAVQTVLIVAPHPDDEAIGCGGMIQRLSSEGKNVHIAIMSNGEAAHRNCCNLESETIIWNRRELTKKAAGILGLSVDRIWYLDYPDSAIAWDHSATDRLEELLERIKPDTVFIPHLGEGWSDHLAAGKIVKRLLAGRPETKIFSYCIWFWYYNGWRINWRNARLLTMNKREHRKKLDAMRAYTEPKAPCNTPWSGNLPKQFLRANEWKRELYFREN